MRAIPREKASHLEPYQRSAINIVFSAIGHQKEGQVGAFEKMYKNLNEGQERKNERRIYRTAMQSFEQSEASLLAQSVSPHAPVGVSAAIRAATDSTVIPRPRIFDEFSLKDRVGIVTGGNSGLGLEMALVLCELGARAVYCFDGWSMCLLM